MDPPTLSVPVIVSSDACKLTTTVDPVTFSPPETVVLKSTADPPTMSVPVTVSSDACKLVTTLVPVTFSPPETVV